jgi:beta-lactamase regulating signal transducer with metallopeptidase domain
MDVLVLNTIINGVLLVVGIIGVIWIVVAIITAIAFFKAGNNFRR